MPKEHMCVKCNTSWYTSYSISVGACCPTCNSMMHNREINDLEYIKPKRLAKPSVPVVVQPEVKTHKSRFDDIVRGE